jgi:hypothetical protein
MSVGLSVNNKEILTKPFLAVSDVNSQGKVSETFWATNWKGRGRF